MQPRRVRPRPGIHSFISSPDVMLVEGCWSCGSMPNVLKTRCNFYYPSSISTPLPLSFCFSCSLYIVSPPWAELPSSHVSYYEYFLTTPSIIITTITFTVGCPYFFLHVLSICCFVLPDTGGCSMFPQKHVCAACREQGSFLTVAPEP